MKTKKRTSLVLPACNEIQIHYKRPLFNLKKSITSSGDAEKILKDFIDLDRIDHKEFFWVILLTNANQVIGISEISVGSTRGVVINYKEILQLALLVNASAIIVAHNHPSGKLNPSQSDYRTTQKLKEVSETLEITLLDHLIITSEGCTSFSDKELM